MALARTFGHVLANPDNMAVFWSGCKQLELQKTLQLYVYLQIHQAHGRQKERMVNYIFVRTLAAAHNDCPIAVLGTDMPKLMKQDLLVSRVS